jgi:hypothetical protein
LRGKQIQGPAVVRNRVKPVGRDLIRRGVGILQGQFARRAHSQRVSMCQLASVVIIAHTQFVHMHEGSFDETIQKGQSQRSYVNGTHRKDQLTTVTGQCSESQCCPLFRAGAKFDCE